jgi:hypothetical protein
MNWNLRYAITKNSYAQIQSVLPTGWHVYGHEDGYKAPNPSDRIVYPKNIKVYNPITKNEATFHDHEDMFDAGSEERKKWRHQNWNFIDHHQEIGEGLKHLDYLAKVTKYEQGYHLDTRRHIRDRDRPKDWAASTYGNTERDIFLNRPSMFHDKDDPKDDQTDTSKIPQSKKNASIKEAISHEVGHINSYENNNLAKFMTLQKKWLQISRNARENHPGLRDQKTLDLLTACSRYGETDPEENYADHFAAWVSGDTNRRAKPNDFSLHAGYNMRWPVTRQIAKWNYETRSHDANKFIDDSISPGISNFSKSLNKQIEQTLR